MKRIQKPDSRQPGSYRPPAIAGSAVTLALLVLSLMVAASGGLRAAEAARHFASPELAVQALESAVTGPDSQAFRPLFGPEAEHLVNPDRVQATNEFRAFAAAFVEAHRLVPGPDGGRILELGLARWPFPIPLTQGPEGWSFNAAAGVQELLNRRIGQNELETLQVLRAYVDAQREYARRDRDGDQVLEFAQRIASSSGRTDGLYWPVTLTGETSPLGPWVARAQGEGYFADPGAPADGPQPFHGYLFRVLTRQGRHAPGGKYNYIINGNMIGGFGLLAWPAAYGDSGIMTFIVNQQGIVHQRDLGPRTAKLVERLQSYDPEPGWEPSRD